MKKKTLANKGKKVLKTSKGNQPTQEDLIKLENQNKMLQELYSLEQKSYQAYGLITTLRAIGQTLEDIRDLLAENFQNDSEEPEVEEESVEEESVEEEPDEDEDEDDDDEDEDD